MVSGKSTIIKAVREYEIGTTKLDFGVYINADDIAKDLREQKFSFSSYKVTTSDSEFLNIALASGLINENYSKELFQKDFQLHLDQRITLVNEEANERVAQIIADFLRKKLLADKRKFSFETVFSHPGKLDIMREAREAGYKVYLYFVSTKNPALNKKRVKLRVIKKGHNVPPDKIESRYYRSLEQLYDASQLAYQAYFFDNSGKKPVLFAHFKQIDGQKNWDDIDSSQVPAWFTKYYSKKIKK